MTAFSVDRAAAALLQARRERRPIPMPTPGPANAADAFAVQEKVAASLGPARAWKVGRGPAVAPFTCAPIAAGLLRPSPCSWPAGELIRLGIEVEIAFRMGCDLPGPGASDEAAVRDAVASIHAAIEIVDSRFEGWPPADPLWALADTQNNGGLVVDEAGRSWAGEPLDRAPVSLTVDGRALFTGEGVNGGGEPFELLLWVARHLAERGTGLKAGDYVTTGSLSGVDFVQPGASVVAEVEGTGRVELSFPAG